MDCVSSKLFSFVLKHMLRVKNNSTNSLPRVTSTISSLKLKISGKYPIYPNFYLTYAEYLN